MPVSSARRSMPPLRDSTRKDSNLPVCSVKLSDMRKSGTRDEVIEPQVGELLLHGVLAQARRQVREVHTIQFLILVEAREDDRLLAGPGIDVLLQALRADFL